MSDQSNNNESENMDNNPTYNDMINPPSWSVEPEQIEGLIELIDNMTNSIQNESNVEDFSEILSDVDSNDNLDNSNNDLEGLETLFQDFDIQEDADIQEDTVFQGLHIDPLVRLQLHLSPRQYVAIEKCSSLYHLPTTRLHLFWRILPA